MQMAVMCEKKEMKKSSSDSAFGINSSCFRCSRGTTASAADATSWSSCTVNPTRAGGKGGGAERLGLRSAVESFSQSASIMSCTSSGSAAYCSPKASASALRELLPAPIISWPQRAAVDDASLCMHARPFLRGRRARWLEVDERAHGATGAQPCAWDLVCAHFAELVGTELLYMTR